MEDEQSYEQFATRKLKWMWDNKPLYMKYVVGMDEWIDILDPLQFDNLLQLIQLSEEQ